MGRKNDSRMPAVAAPVAPMGSEILDQDDRKVIHALCVSHGMTKAQADDFLSRVNKQGALLEFEPSDDDSLTGALENRMMLILQNMDAVIARQANLHQLGGAFKVLFDTRQLLKGKPTNIISIEDRRAIQDVHKRLIEELERRELHVVEMKDVTPK